MAKEQLDTAGVAARIGVATDSLRSMKARDPLFMPEPDGYIAKSPWWWSTTIDRWNKKRPARGERRSRVDA
jgi:hypothetical protein